ncbi:MAG: sugar transferase [Lachnospiraceae bacterium]|jgi:lipopolysaccharide/colanic/teichoic acid biosynthesis glycosyltransferase|nr:sugar transferase [Lachnospiraceae bacterium]
MKKNEQIDYYSSKIPIVKDTFYTKYGKRAIDIILSGMGIIAASPAYLVISILEVWFHGHPIMYASQRPGKDEKLFSIYKFRSMTNETDEDGNLLPENQRLTKFGRFIRKTSLDELPELFNIFKGDMSIIGPRPLLVDYLPLYSKRHRMRHKVRPGLACFRIIDTGRNTWTWGDQFENDIWYLEHVSLWTDIRMIFAVVKKVFEASDVRADDTRVKFDGGNLSETRSRYETTKM